MFETSVIQGQPRVAAGRLSLLSISLIAHTAVIVGAIAFSIASVDFPSTAPDEFSQAPVFLPLLVPPPLGNPNGGAVRTPTPVKPAVAAPQPPPNQITAPSVVPDVVPQLAASTGNTTGPVDPNATVAGPRGVADGDPNSVSDDLTALPGIVAAQPVAERIYEASEVKAPVALFRPAPPYPQIFVKAKLRATVVVRCIIDKNGHVRDPQVIVPAMVPFNDAVVTAVRQWRFTPGSLNGQAVETYLNLTVNFAVN